MVGQLLRSALPESCRPSSFKKFTAFSTRDGANFAAGLKFEYYPIDICRQAIIELTATLHRRLRDAALRVRGIVAEYTDALAAFRRQPGVRNLVLFLGSNIGNFSHPEARRSMDHTPPASPVISNTTAVSGAASAARARTTVNNRNDKNTFNLLAICSPFSK